MSQDGTTNAQMTTERDDDLPMEIRRLLMDCAVANGRISYYWLCDLYRRGVNDGRLEAAEAIDEVIREALHRQSATVIDGAMSKIDELRQRVHEAAEE